jgi:hypothetical protein
MYLHTGWDKFTEFVDGAEPFKLQLRVARCGFFRWPFEVLFDGQRKMYMHTGWDKFVCAHNLVAGCLLTFLYKDDGEMIVKVFDKTT